MKTGNTKQMRQFIFVNLSILIFLIALSVGNVANAQPPGGQGGGQQGPPEVPNAKQIKKMVADLSKKLSLNDEQQEKISELYIAHFAEVKEATSSGRPERSKMEALQTKFENEVKAELTTEQQKKFTAYQKKNAQRQGPPRR